MLNLWPKTMATKISHKVQEYRTSPPLIQESFLKKIRYFQCFPKYTSCLAQKTSKMHRISMKRPKICAKHIKSVYKRLFAFFDCGEYSTNWNWFTAFCVSHVKCSRIVHTAENIFKMNIYICICTPPLSQVPISPSQNSSFPGLQPLPTQIPISPQQTVMAFGLNQLISAFGLSLLVTAFGLNLLVSAFGLNGFRLRRNAAAPLHDT